MSGRVLVVDDEPQIRRRVTLRANGYDVDGPQPVKRRLTTFPQIHRCL